VFREEFVKLLLALSIQGQTNRAMLMDPRTALDR